MSRICYHGTNGFCEKCFNEAAQFRLESVQHSHQHGQPATAPLVVCLCGSTRFFKEFMLANFNETMAGRIVLSVGFYPHSSEQAHGEHIGISVADKLKLDDLHKRKIDLCNEVLVINVGGYIGESTRSEIEYATALGKRIRYLEPQQA